MIGSIILGYLFKLDALGAVAGTAYVFLIFYWDWPTVKTWFGVATVGALFSRNIVFGAIIFCCYMLLSVIAGVIFLFLALLFFMSTTLLVLGVLRSSDLVNWDAICKLYTVGATG